MAFEIIYTNKGLNKLVLAESGTPLVFEKFAVGDGESPPTPEQTALQNEKWRGSISKAAPSITNPQRLLLECMVPADIDVTEAFYIRELGLFDVEGDLIAIAQVPESYYAPTSDGLGSEKLYNFTLSISNEAEVTLQLDSTIYATQQSVAELEQKVDILTDQFNTELDNVNVRVDTTNSNLDDTNTKVNSIDSRVGTVESQVSTLDSRVDSLDSSVDSLDSSVNSLDSRLDTLEPKVSSLSSQVSSLNSQVGSLNSKVNNLDSEVDDLSYEVADNTSAVKAMGATIALLLKSQIGEIVINMNPKHHNKLNWNDGVFIYLLCNSQGIPSAYSDLKAIYGNYTPDFRDGTIRNLPTSSGRDLGSYQDHAMQNITGSTYGVFTEYSSDSSGALSISNIDYDGDLYDHKKGNGRGRWAKLNFDASKVVKTDSETRMKNVGVQFYVKAHLLI
ncbi:Phage tail-collar fiber protein [Candidatus Hepatincola sp. Pdp]